MYAGCTEWEPGQSEGARDRHIRSSPAIPSGGPSPAEDASAKGVATRRVLPNEPGSMRATVSLLERDVYEGDNGRRAKG